MIIGLYINLSESNFVDKNIINETIVTGTLRESTSITNPIFNIESDLDNIATFNYIYVQEWNRYYFVTDVVSAVKGIWSFKCHVDVLSTYRTHIRGLSAIIARQENLYNLYLDDDKFLVNAQRMYTTKIFPNRVQPGNAAGASSFIFTVAGGADVESS